MKFSPIAGAVAAAIAACMLAAGSALAQAAHRHQVQPRRRRSTRRRARAPSISRSSPRSAPRAASRSRSTRTARCSRTARRWRRCSSARCRCWRRRSPSSARSACANSRCSTCRTSSTTTRSCTRSPKDPVGAALFKKLETKGIVGLAYWDNGFKVMSANKPIRIARRLQGPQDAHPVVEGAGRRDQGARRHSAGDGVLRGLPGAADRRRRRHREPAVELLHAEDARSAEVPGADQPRLPGLRGHRQQEVLGRPAGRHPRRRSKAR